MNGMNQITVIGTGLLGASLGLALRRAGWRGRRIGVGRRQETVDRALAAGAFDAVTTEADKGVTGSDLVVIATPLGAFETVLRSLAGCDLSRAVLTDVGSTKQHVCDLARELLPAPSQFVGSHPMAGSERQGPQWGRADLYAGALCILTPEGTAAEAGAVQKVSALWETVGMQLTTKTPAEHDRLVATISHLPHAAAVLLVKLADEQKAISVASSGFRDTTRVASGDATVWRDIFTTNRDAMLETLDTFAAEVAALRDAIDRGDGEAITALLQQQKTNRDRWLRGRGWDQ